MKKFIILFFMASILNGCIETATGEKIGTVVKVSEEGFIFKTWEVEIIRGGLNSGSGGFSSHPFDATVSDPQVLKILQDALNSQKEIIIKYHRETLTPPWRNEDHENENRFIDSAEIVK